MLRVWSFSGRLRGRDPALGVLKASNARLRRLRCDAVACPLSSFLISAPGAYPHRLIPYRSIIM